MRPKSMVPQWSQKVGDMKEWSENRCRMFTLNLFDMYCGGGEEESGGGGGGGVMVVVAWGWRWRWRR